MYQDKVLACKDCGAEFTFSASEQEFYAEKGFTNEPGRCPECRAARKAQGRNGGNGGYSSNGYSRPQREMYPAVCATCGKETTVPFQPTGDKPVYCRDCYQPRTRSNW
jgi:CxxC-x17-CxxC domain-containing protein